MSDVFSLLGKKGTDERKQNTLLGLLSAFAGSTQGQDLIGAAGGAAQGSLGFANQLQRQKLIQQKLAQQKALQEAQMKRMAIQNAYTQAQTGQVGKPPPMHPANLALRNAQTNLTTARTGQVGKPTPKHPYDLAYKEALTDAAHARANLYDVQSEAGPKSPNVTADQRRVSAIRSTIDRLSDNQLPMFGGRRISRQDLYDGLVAKTISLQESPTSGKAIWANSITNEVYETPIKRGPGFPKEGGAIDRKSRGTMFHFSPEAISKGIVDEWLGFVFPSKNASIARSEARIFREDLIHAYTRPGMRANWAQKRVERLMPSMNNPFRGATGAAEDLRSLKADLQQEATIAKRTLTSASRASPARGKAQSKLDSITKAIGTVNMMLNNVGGGSGELSPAEAKELEELRRKQGVAP